MSRSPIWIVNDPLETQNLIGQPQVAEIERTLRSYLASGSMRRRTTDGGR